MILRSFLASGAILLASLCHSEGGFVAFNDYAPGVFTHRNATVFGPGQSGKLKDITSGAALAVTVAVTTNRIAYGNVQGVPGYGTPASVLFDGFVYFGGLSPGLESSASTNDVTYTFSGLNPEALYNFQGTAMRGHFAYKDRWSLFELQGAQNFTSHHTVGCLQHADVAAIAPNQVAINTGDNTPGAVAWWEEIKPAADGTFSVRCTRYTGAVPGGSSAGSPGYGITGFRLEEAPNYTGRTELPPRTPNPAPARLAGIETVFIVLMENHDWASINGSSYCPYINKTLLPMSSYITNYIGAPGTHPSEPNYLWLLCGTNFNIRSDDPPSKNHQNSTHTLFRLLDDAGIPWKGYFEGISGSNVPDTDKSPYAVRHNPFLFFDWVRTNAAYVTNHIRPFEELAIDLANDTAPRFCFLVPNITNDMHNLTTGSPSTRLQGDNWLAREMPKIFDSAAYKRGGALFLTWDEGSGESDGPIGMIVVSPRVKGGGYRSSRFYTHSSTLRTFQDIFGVRPYLEDAQFAEGLDELFAIPQITWQGWVGNALALSCESVSVGSTNYLQMTTDLGSGWTTIQTNIAAGTKIEFSDPAPVVGRKFYRIQSAH